MKHGYYINTFLFLVFMLITVNQAKAECKFCFLRISFFSVENLCICENWKKEKNETSSEYEWKGQGMQAVN